MPGETKASLSMMGNTNRLGFKTSDKTKRRISRAMKRKHAERRKQMASRERKLLLDTIRLLLDTLKKPVTEINHVDKFEAIAAGEIVYDKLTGKD
jgi:RNA-splicing ligase RtcB